MSEITHEIAENKFYNYDVYDVRLAGRRWLACFRMFQDAKTFIDESCGGGESRPVRVTCSGAGMRPESESVSMIRNPDADGALDRSAGVAPGPQDTLDISRPRLNPGAKMSDWQPIETAPKDASSVLLCDMTECPSPLVVVGYYGTNMEEANSKECWRVKWDHSDLSGGYEPTHWMPLPQSPQEREGLGHD